MAQDARKSANRETTSLVTIVAKRTGVRSAYPDGAACIATKVCFYAALVCFAGFSLISSLISFQ